MNELQVTHTIQEEAFFASGRGKDILFAIGFESKNKIKVPQLVSEVLEPVEPKIPHAMRPQTHI